VELVRAAIFHTPENAFHFAGALRAFADGALAIEAGKILACGSCSEVRARFPEAKVRDLRGSTIVPGFVDTHIHFPQVRVIGGLGYTLLDWLDELTLPEESRMADTAYAATIASEFVQGLAAHGTTTALVFGAHFVAATAALFDAAAGAGLRVIGGLVLSDRNLRAELHTTPENAWRDSIELMGRLTGHARLGYAVIPRFALSASEPILEVCQALLKHDATLRFTTHINENPREVEAVARQFPWASDYLEVYEKFDLIGRHSVLAHNVHPSDSEIVRVAASGASVAHCPCSNAALGSGIFPLRRHVERDARFALGSDVGGGTGFGMLKEALQAHLLQRVAADPVNVTPAQMLYLATRAGAEALGMSDRIGDFEVGKCADFVVLRGNGTLASFFTPGSFISEVRVENDIVYRTE
jgi:guanine deaminase